MRVTMLALTAPCFMVLVRVRATVLVEAVRCLIVGVMVLAQMPVVGMRCRQVRVAHQKATFRLSQMPMAIVISSGNTTR